MMEDDDVLLEVLCNNYIYAAKYIDKFQNDPLSIYLKNQQLGDFETTNVQTEDNKNNLIRTKTDIKINHSYWEYQLYFENILKSELLLEEDYSILETYYSNNIVQTKDKFKQKIIISSTLSLFGGLIFKYATFKFIKYIGPVCSFPLLLQSFNFIKRQIKIRTITSLLQKLNILTKTNKKCLKLIGEFSATIGYYSSATLNSSTLNIIYIRFVKQYYALLLSIIKLLAFNCSQIISAVPLTIENSFNYGMKEDLFLKDEVNISDVKLLFELYLLVQSDFIKTLGLSFCSYLWTDLNCDINKLLNNYVPALSLELNDKINSLEKEYCLLRNYGMYTRSSSIRSPRKFNNTPSNYLNSCLHNVEIHFQQLLCKTRDLQNIVEQTEFGKPNENTEVINIMISEMEKQMISSKNVFEVVTKYFMQLQNKTDESETKVTMPEPVTATVKTVENQEEELAKQEKLTYELYIPKEGLDLTELEIDNQRPVFSIKDNYSGMLLQELRTILKVRNPDVFEENTRKPDINSDSESEDEFYNSYKRRNIFRPTQQPVGLAENLQTINNVLAARKNFLQCEDICGDTSDNEDAVIEN